jgi:hypothetical protein
VDEELKTARAVLDVMATQAERAEAVLTQLAAKISTSDAGLALGLTSQAKALRLAADEALKLVELLGTKTQA